MMRLTKILLPLLALLATDALAADVVGKQSVRTNTAGDVTVTLSDGTTPANLAQIAASNGVAAANGVFILGGTYNSSLPTNTTGRSVSLQTDINGRLIVTQDASAGAMLANITKVGGTAVALGQTTMTASFPVAIASDQSNLPSNIKQVNGSTLSLGQTTMSASLPVAIASNQGALAVTQGADTGAAMAVPGTTSIAASGSSTVVLKSGIAVSTPTKARLFRLTATQPVVCKFQYNDNASITILGWLAVSPASPSFQWKCQEGYPCGLTTSATSTTQQYEAVCTNLDPSQTSDVHTELMYCSAASGC